MHRTLGILALLAALIAPPATAQGLTAEPGSVVRCFLAESSEPPASAGSPYARAYTASTSRAKGGRGLWNSSPQPGQRAS